MGARQTSPTWPTAAVVALLSAASASAGGDAGPSLRANAKVRVGPDGNAAHSGVLTKAYCFASPTHVCVPAKSTVFFTSSTPGPRADEGTPRVTSYSLQAVDASAPFKAFGITFAAHAPLPSGPDDGGDTPTMSLEFRGFDVRGLLGQALTLGGQRVAAGPIELHLDDTWVPEAILRGVAPTALIVGGWRVPAGTLMYVAGLPDGFTLTPRPGAKLTRDAADEYPPSATSVEHTPAWSMILTTVEGSPPFEVNGVTLTGRVSLARHGTTGPWEMAMGTLGRAATIGDVSMPEGATVTLCGTALERVTAPEGKRLNVAGHPTFALTVEHERPIAPTGPWVDDCTRGKVTGYAIPLEGCPPPLHAALLDAAFKPRDAASVQALARCKGPPRP
jgi:hypothetical protein